jgi:hypothetical protein
MNNAKSMRSILKISISQNSKEVIHSRLKINPKLTLLMSRNERNPFKESLNRNSFEENRASTPNVSIEMSTGLNETLL